MDVLRLLLQAARPRQWTKNLVVLGAVIFSGQFTDPALLGRSVAAFVSFCALSSAVYVANDIRDIEFDREHPRKKHRPLASGRLKLGHAWVAVAGLAVVALGIAVPLGSGFLLSIAAYLALQGAYALWFKNLVVLDIMSIAAGFVIRAVAGGQAIDVPISSWLLVCAALLALFLAAAKRRHELILLGETHGLHRPVLEEYTPELLDQVTATLSAATITAYTLYTFFAHEGDGVAWMMLTVPFVLYGVLRYQYLVLSRDQGGAPEEVLLTDKPILIDVALWIATAGAILYLQGS
jgi:4-hydroxybenzoate polyprenyltransferase